LLGASELGIFGLFVGNEDKVPVERRGVMNRSQRVLVTLTLAACADAGPGTQPVIVEPVAPGNATTSLRGTVDVAAGTLTFESLVPGEVRPASIYGNQGVTVRLYNTPVTVAASPTPGKETYTANVGLQNWLAFPIGDEQAGATPRTRPGGE
jgi:hypothetical protein